MQLAVVTSAGLAFTPFSNDGSVTLRSGEGFSRGDCNADGVISLPDDFMLLFYLFLNGNEPTCLSACDFDANGALNLNDAIYIQLYMFLNGPPPPAPFMECGTGNAPLGCDSFVVCP